MTISDDHTTVTLRSDIIDGMDDLFQWVVMRSEPVSATLTHEAPTEIDPKLRQLAVDHQLTKAVTDGSDLAPVLQGIYAPVCTPKIYERGANQVTRKS